MLDNRVASGLLFSVCVLGQLYSSAALADPLSISEIQYTVAADGASPQDGNVVDCLGGIVTFRSFGTQPRMYLQDPGAPDGWGAVMVKDWTGTLVNNVSEGDWVSLTGVLVEEHRGNTILQYDSPNNPGFLVQSSANIIPAPRLVSVEDLRAPSEDVPEFWLADNHDAEKYEAMWVTVTDVSVAALDLGKASDNYSLLGAGGELWASDYLNQDTIGDYHINISLGQQLASVTGIVEQYTKIRDTYGWDYYQVLTTSSKNLVVPEPSTSVLLTIVVALLGLRFGWRGRREQFHGQ